MDSLEQYLKSQIAWSKRTFGSHERMAGICKHIEKELEEIRNSPPSSRERHMEWIDVIILAMDGYWRSGGLPEGLLRGLVWKQNINFGREWPKNSKPDQPTEHIPNTKLEKKLEMMTPDTKEHE